MSKHAQFTAVVKKMATDDKKVVVNLEMVGKLDPYAMAEIVDMVGEKVVVNLGNPQMVMAFDEEEKEERRGLSVTTDQSGVVTSVSGSGEEGHEDTGGHGVGDEEGEGNQRDESSDNDEGSQSNPEIQATDTGEGAENQEAAAASIDKDKLEAYILSGQAPSFEEIEYDFPALLARKQNGETWIKIASSISTSSTKLQAAWAKYKKLVAEHMVQNGEEPGAA